MGKLNYFLKYIAPYKVAAVKNILFNVLSAVFALFSYTLIVPFLRILFNLVEPVPNPGKFVFSPGYLNDYMTYHLSVMIEKEGQIGALMIVCAVFLIASLLKNGFIFLSNNCMAYIRSSTVRDIRQKIYQKIMRLHLSFFSDSRKGDIMTRISNDVQEVESSVISSMTMMFRDPITIVIFMIYLFVTSYQLTLFALVFLPVSGWFIGKVSRTLKSKAFLGQQYLGRLLSVVEETLSGLKIIKGFNAEKKMQQQFDNLNNKYAKTFKRVLRKNYLASPLSEFLASIAVIIIMFFGCSLVFSSTTTGLTPDKLIAFIIVFSQIISPLKSITTAWFNIQKGIASIDRIELIINAEEQIVEKPDAVSVKSFDKEIEFRNIWYAYNTEPVLKDISLKIKKGQTVAIVGRSGAGKSTLVDLLPRFIDPDRGGVFIDGVDIRDAKVADIRSLMGIVSQQPILFNSSFAENIAFGLDEMPSMKSIELAAGIANAHDFICETDEGYDNLVGEGGGKLSGGQRQRISIARAIMANPPILILDEATSSLDTESERLVQDAIQKLMKSRTSIVIAHRLSTIQHADLIVVMENGRIVETGTHAELIRLNGHYSKLRSYQEI